MTSHPRTRSLHFSVAQNEGDFECADFADRDREMNDNTKGIKVKANPRDEVCLVSDIMRDTIEKMRSKMLARPRFRQRSTSMMTEEFFKT